MSTLSQYKNFINEAEGGFTGGNFPRVMKLFVSPKLESILEKINKGIDPYAKAVANRILRIDSEPEDNKFSISFIDLVKDKDDEISFLPVGRAYYLKGWKSSEEGLAYVPSPSDEFWTSSGRQTQRIGKFINSLWDNFSDKAVDSFVNTFKAEIAATQIYDRFRIVEGEDIRHWYAGSNYYNEGSSSQLGGSCMRYDGKVDGKREDCRPYFDIYVQNPEVCKMLVLIHPTGKLLGRALLWGPLKKPTGKLFLDRIYTVKQSDIELFKKYAMEKGWIYKYQQAANDTSYVEDGQRVQKSMAVTLKPKDYKYYPFMDTFKYYNPYTGRLGSDPGNPVPNSKRLKLEQTGGQFQRID